MLNYQIKFMPHSRLSNNLLYFMDTQLTGKSMSISLVASHSDTKQVHCDTTHPLCPTMANKTK